ncbi:MAG: SPOR domain-containing protein, partial [Alphaproteobacteria bacterium]|nr:SPOR domain-containing protein [Alphaproteobacteria bacterium]
EDFDDKYTLDIFQKTAAANRKELVATKKYGYNNDYPLMLNSVMSNYPEMEHLRINGVNIHDERYIKTLVSRARRVAENLIEITQNYRNITLEMNKENVRSKLYQSIGDAIFIQVELAYNLVEQLSIQLAALQEEVRKQRKDIKVKEKSVRGMGNAKIELLNLKNKLLETELQESKLIASRAAALRSLYFYAGFSPFSRVLLEQKIKIIADNLKIAFNQDMISMLTISPVVETGTKEWEVKDEDWAKGENWLEQLVDERKQLGKNALDGYVSENVAVSTAVVSADNMNRVDDYDKRKILQLGAYVKKESAELEWNMLQRIYPELKTQTPKIEETVINDKKWYRLYVESDNGGWSNLCERLKKNNFGCILR